MSTLGKPQRQHRILRMLEDQPVSSQAQLVQLLEAEGIVATQATVSRDLEELGAVKVRIPGGAMAYAIPDCNRERAPVRRPPEAADGRVRRRGLAQRQPGRAAHAARQRARGRVGARPGVDARHVLGTVAGDDTVLVVCTEPSGGASVAAELAAPRRTLSKGAASWRSESCSRIPVGSTRRSRCGGSARSGASR